MSAVRSCRTKERLLEQRDVDSILLHHLWASREMLEAWAKMIGSSNFWLEWPARYFELWKLPRTTGKTSQQEHDLCVQTSQLCQLH